VSLLQTQQWNFTEWNKSNCRGYGINDDNDGDSDGGGDNNGSGGDMMIVVMVTTAVFVV
jgi:hypothetical protein